MTLQNQLCDAVSPYLLQHKDNPVHWQIWSSDALALAKQTGKPILLSVGYAACHWCHVMAHESFEDPATAAVMNDLFVNIKVDREERPDVDHLYMSALHALGQQGGWPLTMFLSSDAEPFWGGTYFPKEARYGRPGFADVLRQISGVYHTDPARVQKNTQALHHALNAKPDATGDQLTEGMFAILTDSLAQRIDMENGGIGGAPKFPNVPLLTLLWRGGDRLKRSDIQGLVLLTLQHICEGGIYDHLGGGFARYAVDARWLVPHFEKMLYDNAQLLELLGLAYTATRHPLFAARARETVEWLAREMTSEGAFSASLDADSEGIEGKFYVWTADGIETVLGPEDAAFFARFYDVTAQGNWHDEHTGETVTILNRLRAPETTAQDEERLAPLRTRLLDARSGRVRPGLDDKILADWNGLMISALVRAAIVFDAPEWIARAETAFAFIATTMNRDGRLAHAYREGRVTYPGFALDYAAMISAALTLHEATENPRYLELAITWARALEAHHGDAQTGLFFMSADDARDVVSRQAPTGDEAVPNAHGVLAGALVTFAAQTGDAAWQNKADRLFEATTAAILANPLAHASLLNAFDYRLRVATVVIAGKQREHLRHAALALPFLNRVVIEIQSPSDLPEAHPARAQALAAGEGAAFVCAGGRCSLPVHTPEDMRARFEEMVG